MWKGLKNRIAALLQLGKKWWLTRDCNDFFFAFGDWLHVGAATNQLPRGWTSNAIMLWAMSFNCKVSAQVAHFQSHSNCNHSQKFWQRFANNCHLCQSIRVSLQQWVEIDTSSALSRLCNLLYYRFPGCIGCLARFPGTNVILLGLPQPDFM